MQEADPLLLSSFNPPPPPPPSLSFYFSAIVTRPPPLTSSACDLVPPSRAELSPFVRRRKPFSTPGEGEGRGTSGSSLTSWPRAGNIRKQLGKIKRVDAGKWRADPLLDPPPLSLSLLSVSGYSIDGFFPTIRTLDTAVTRTSSSVIAF